jgi:spore germination protein YaaH
MAEILADPGSRSAHVEALLAFADEGDYDGLDLDYEQFAFADPRRTWETTRPNWVAFVDELADGLHADGRTLTVSIPPIYDAGTTSSSGFWVYDYASIAPLVDRIRIMAYDFSVNEAGPIAPLSFVERAIEGALEATDAPDKLVLGIPAYGRNWPVFVDGDCPESELQGITSITTRTVDDLIARRGATPAFDETTGEAFFEYDLEVTDGERTCTETRQVHYVDARGIRMRMDLAREYQLDGVALWALGFEDDEVWAAILPTVGDGTSGSAPEDSSRGASAPSPP